MKSVRHSLIGLALFTVVAIIAGMFIVNAIRQPLHEATQTYRVEFSDVTGLRPGNDVRMLGTRVGKVTGIDLQQSDGGEQTFATVTVGKEDINMVRHLLKDHGIKHGIA